MVGSSEARAIHAEFPAIDLHADSLMWSRWLGYDLQVRHTPPLPWAALGGHVDVPRLIDGGLGAQFFGLVSIPLGQRKGLAAAIDAQIDELDRACHTAPDKLVKVRSASELRAVQARGAVGALLGIEGAHALEGNLDTLDHFVRRGVRYLGFVHFTANQAAYPAYGRGRNDTEGLTAFGRDLVRRCESLGVLVDLAHMNRTGFLEACTMAKRPPIVSHTGVLGVFNHWRNVGDDQLRAVANKGGVVGVIFCPRYLGGDGLDAVVAHLKHILQVCGEDTPALGSDWDGFIVPTPQLCDATRLPALTDALLQAGVKPQVVGKILQGNALRILGD